MLFRSYRAFLPLNIDELDEWKDVVFIAMTFMVRRLVREVK